MLTVSFAWIHKVMMQTTEMPFARKTAAEQTPVVVLDAGSGESTET
ncbi:MAG: hypothetical protein J5753_07280 [Oscillospiraceae bacterium]|nr:hypothetical protein [Oscillospiraceae bacterium]